MNDLIWVVRITMTLVLVAGGMALWDPVSPAEQLFVLIFGPPILFIGWWLLREMGSDHE